MSIYDINYSVEGIDTFAPLYIPIYAENKEIAKEKCINKIFENQYWTKNIEDIKIHSIELYKNKIGFISGHLDLTNDEFKEFYIPLISKALMKHEQVFIVGDAKGADTLAQNYLNQLKFDNLLVLVYHMFESPRNYINGFEKIGGFKSDKERDSAMTLASSYDIAWVRSGREKSGTAKNIERRKKHVSTQG